MAKSRISLGIGQKAGGWTKSSLLHFGALASFDLSTMPIIFNPQTVQSATKDNENCDPRHLLRTRLGKLEVELGFGDLETNPSLPVYLNAFHLSLLQDINNSHLPRIMEKPRVLGNLAAEYYLLPKRQIPRL